VAEAAPVVVAEDLVIEYAGRLRRAGFRAVDRVSFSIAPGEVVGLVGESGSGKTTIGRAIAGLTPVTGGSLRVLGVEMNGVKERTFRPHRKDLGFVFQDPATSFNPLLTIAQNVAEPLIVHGGARDAADARDRVDELLEACSCRRRSATASRTSCRAGSASGLAGPRPRLDPKLLIADEPTSALDVSVQARVLELFGELQERFGFATLFITHDLAVVDMLAHRVVVLHKGTIAETGPTARCSATPGRLHPQAHRVAAGARSGEQAARREAWRAARG
jgi:peptide/nickel transport system ATP-binding protein